jgi:hypothetical protein
MKHIYVEGIQGRAVEHRGHASDHDELDAMVNQRLEYPLVTLGHGKPEPSSRNP